MKDRIQHSSSCIIEFAVKNDKIPGKPSIIYIFLNSFNKYIEDIQIFGRNVPFISSSEAKNAYFMSGEATNDIYILSLHEMK